ncbi:glycogenin-1 isoform X1 [Daphnia magna]|uniref:glycogenin glucosyltransferase n=1 Tax=Daphnia magna TaxID=35525 RepID=A0A164U037_9CRUS|nr:glycogenin-1 isoform X1 [Daphnia magna]KZS10928.1 Glycogenin-1 [Daphnia magna]
MAAEAWVTLATNDSYAVGALVLAHSLKSVNSTRPLVVMITDQVSSAMRNRLGEISCRVQEVNVMDSKDSAHLALLARPELGITFTKLHCWTLTDFSKCVFLDADTLVIQNCDELFDREEFSAAADAGWPDCFNSGVFVFRPSMETYGKLVEFAVAEGSFDGGDQGLLNSYFADWATKDISRRLPFIYNMTASASYSYRPAYKQFGKNVRIVHFIGSPKPWQASEASAFQNPVPGDHIAHWWRIFICNVLPRLSSDMFPILRPHNRSIEQLNVPPSPSSKENICSTSINTENLTLVNVALEQPWNAVDVKEGVTEAALLNQSDTLTSNLESPSVSTSDLEFVSISTSTLNHYSFAPVQLTSDLPLPSTTVPRPSFIESDSFASDTDSGQPEHTGVAAQFSQLAVKEVPEPITDNQDEKPLFSSPPEVTVEATASVDSGPSSREAWEQGFIDYTGKDSFDNIMQKIKKTLESNKKP